MTSDRPLQLSGRARPTGRLCHTVAAAPPPQPNAVEPATRPPPRTRRRGSRETARRTASQDIPLRRSGPLNSGPQNEARPSGEFSALTSGTLSTKLDRMTSEPPLQWARLSRVLGLDEAGADAVALAADDPERYFSANADELAAAWVTDAHEVSAELVLTMRLIEAGRAIPIDSKCTPDEVAADLRETDPVREAGVDVPVPAAQDSTDALAAAFRGELEPLGIGLAAIAIDSSDVLLVAFPADRSSEIAEASQAVARSSGSSEGPIVWI